jgi:hypothetical protein
MNSLAGSNVDYYSLCLLVWTNTNPYLYTPIYNNKGVAQQIPIPEYWVKWRNLHGIDKYRRIYIDVR